MNDALNEAGPDQAQGRPGRTGADTAPPLAGLLAGDAHRRVGRRRWLLLTFAVVAAGTAWYALQPRRASDGPHWLTEPAKVGELVVTVSATGNLQPTNQVDVGSELSGIVYEVFVDDNDRVRKGQLLARLDVERLDDAVARSRASLAVAEAQVLQADATVAETSAVLARFRQVAALSGGKVPSQAEIDTAVANVKRAEANAASARAAVGQARAALQTDLTNLERADIISPIDGVVLTRQIEPGQTVAASFQTPVLFTLAEDLAQMELRVDVDEADIGQVHEGQTATFTVDAWPGRRYDAVISRVGYGAQEKDGVISYPTTLAVRNEDLSLRPGMTGTTEITTLTRQDALLVPNAALRFTPEAPAAAPTPSRGMVGALLPRPPAPARRPQAAPVNGGPRVWVLRNGEPTPVPVTTGATNGRVTEITGGGLEAGAEVITEMQSPAR